MKWFVLLAALLCLPDAFALYYAWHPVQMFFATVLAEIINFFFAQWWEEEQAKKKFTPTPAPYKVDILA